ncbi:unnamed protein product [Bursaphelenchus xylophilus]|uniref:(pine wood nematode) hypothetical protein n=1 Tax=Bursaphelenchus xylophilus TaxID=6326 RepID=A0A811M2K2_BURXY|nr:unnamed protein product [Bursaphelenchus xylophilus]CAG9129732.1 unnamed protein product [Bursaphelenchus xylophilus]
MSVSSIQPTLPLWMIETWNSSSAEQGVSFLPMTLGYLINTQIFGHISHRFGRWKLAMAGLLIIGIAGFVIPYCPNRFVLIFPVFFTGMGIAIVDVTMFSMLGTIVDKRHSSAYGSVFAIGDSAECLAFAAGPFLAGPFVKWFGFKYAMFFMGGINLLYIPFMILLKNLDGSDGKESNGSDESIGFDGVEFTKTGESDELSLRKRRPSELYNASNKSLKSLSLSI